jgi:DNA-binding Lrp family transcriptional regulator
MSVAEHDLECVARIISAFPEVNHNYERAHEYNLWFVVTASSEEHLEFVLQEIEQHAEYPLMSLPMLDDYFIDLGFKLNWAN